MTPHTPPPLNPTRLSIRGHGGLRLNAWDYGGDGPDLILAHCTGTLARVWDPVVRELYRHFHCYAIDTRGHGDSQPPHTRDEYAWHLSGHDLLHMVDQLGLQSPIYAAGHSAGGAHVGYALTFRPGVFERVAFIDSIIGPDTIFGNFENPLAALVRRRVNVFASPDAARERLSNKPPMAHWVPDAVDAYITHGLRERDDGQWELKLPGDREAWFYELGGATDLFEKLKTIETPSLVIAGENSDVLILPQLQHQELPHSDYHVVEAAGHFIPQEKPAEIAALLRRLTP